MKKQSKTELLARGKKWFTDQDWQPFPFQEETWRAYLDGKSGLLNAPTGSGKTYALFMPILLEALNDEPLQGKQKAGLRALWITPIRALTKDIQSAGQRAADELGLDWRIGIRTGDTKTSERTKQKKNAPQVLITTPESLHLLLAMKEYQKYFKNLKCVVIDEWHELLGSKRGVQTELALAHLKFMLPPLKIWGISATIGNMREAESVLFGLHTPNRTVIKAEIDKQIEVETLLPDEIERFPWAGHLGMKMLEKVIPIIERSKTTLIFTNTRAQCEIWYRNLLEDAPDLVGAVAMHHGSISREMRNWVEDALHAETLKAVVCTSSLDLGVDFRPVESIVQIGSPKGVARFVQRAGRSGHRPGVPSRIYFVPTNTLELIEAAALRAAVRTKKVESRKPYVRSFDVLVQFLVTLAVSEGFYPEELLPEIRSTYSFADITDAEWQWCLNFITHGAASLEVYDEFKKVEIEEDGKFKVNSRRVAMRHRLSMGTINGEASLRLKFLTGKNIGSVEEWFISQLKVGDTFWFGGRSLELVRVKDMQVQVKKSKKKTGKIPAFLGGRLPLSSQLAEMLRIKTAELNHPGRQDVELEKLAPLADIQAYRSHIPHENELLVEYFKSREGYHLLIYPYEGRFVHEGMSALLAWRIAQQQPITFTMAMNDYGFELLSVTPIDAEKVITKALFHTDNLHEEILAGINSTELAKRRFRDIASVAGLVFKGYPGKQKKDRHLQASSQLFFKVFQDYEPENLLLQQAYEEVMNFQLEEARIRACMERIQSQKIVLTQPSKATPFSFPIIVDRLRERLTSEKLEDRIKRMKLQLVRD